MKKISINKKTNILKHEEFTLQQEKNLRNILKLNSKVAIHTIIGINHLLYENSFEDLYNEFKEQIPVFDYISFLNYIRDASEAELDNITLLIHKNLIAKNKPALFALRDKDKVFPISKKMFSTVLYAENKVISAYSDGKVFSIFENTDIYNLHGYDIGEMRALQMKHRSYFDKIKFKPNLGKITSERSRYQRMHEFISELEKSGSDIEVIIARPQTLMEVSFLLSQREGRFVPLKELCPNLKSFVYYITPITSYKQEIKRFFEGLEVSYMEMLYHPSGLIAIQAKDEKQGYLELINQGEIFYEFVHITDIKNDGSLKRGHKRYYSKNLKINERYLVLITNDAGLLSYNTREIVDVVSVSPVRIKSVRKLGQLHHFGESISSNLAEKVVYQVNKNMESYGVYVREFILADDISTETPLWIFELDKPINRVSKSDLQYFVNTMHNEMQLQSSSYKKVIAEENSMPLPKMIFLSYGTFNSMDLSINFKHIDPTGEVVRSLLEKSSDHITLQPEVKL